MIAQNSEKKLSDFSRNYLYLDSGTMEKTLFEDEMYKNNSSKRSNAIVNCITLLVPIVTITVSSIIDNQASIFSFSSFLPVLSFVLWSILITLFLWNIKDAFDATKIIKAYNSNNASIYSHVIEASNKNTKYTAVILLADKKDNEQIRFFCRKADSFLFHCYLEQSDTIFLAIEKIKKSIVSLGVKDSEIIDITPLNEEPIFSIKVISGKPTSVALFLFSTKLEESALKSILKQDGVWLTIDEMKQNPIAMKTNYDVIEEIDLKRDQLSSSFFSSNADMHIIWNITQKCKFNCRICATADSNRKELDINGKLKVLLELANEKERIKTLDFAGGDPFNSSESLNIIQAAIDVFGKDKISITTTAVGLEEVGNLLPCRYELTMDASHQNLLSDTKSLEFRNDIKYNNLNANFNAKQLDLLHEIRGLTINIPILDMDLSDGEIERLVNRIVRIRNDNVGLAVSANLIRLMPTGSFSIILRESQSEFEKYKQYNPLIVANKLKKKLIENNIPCKYHCSLRVLDNNDVGTKSCSMLTQKIGIDCAGNVFSCAWGGYYNNSISPKNNPFYLGNLTEQNLSMILNNNNNTAFKVINGRRANKKNINYCEVVSCFFEGSFGDITGNKDPLAKLSKTAGENNGN